MRVFIGCNFLFAAGLLVGVMGCKIEREPAVATGPFSDNFERGELGADWNNTGGPYEIRDGMLHVQGAFNHPLWLTRALPKDVRIEFDARSASPDGDIKVEVFGDGFSRAETASYTATSYVVILGGWRNQLNVLARMNEHGDDRVVGPAQKVEVKRTYRIKVERRGGLFTVWTDGRKLMEMNDAHPLEGRGHDHFAFNNWQSDLWFDNLQITPL